MAVLQKIREKSGLLVGVIGFCLLAFILGGLLNGGMSLSSRNVGEVNGESISTQDFLVKVQNSEQRGQNSSQVYNQIWNEEVKNILLTEQFEALGMRLGKDGIFNIIKTVPDFAQNPQFLNEAGQFDKAKFNQFLVGIQQSGAQQWNAWLDYEKQLENFAKEQAYYTVIKGAVNTTSLEAKMAYNTANSKTSFDYVTLPYSSVKDEEAKPTDAEILSYIKANEKIFKSEITRTVDYVFIENKPSKEDEQAARKNLEDLLSPSVVFNSQTKKNDSIPGFRGNVNAIDFVNSNSDIPFDSTYYSKEQLPAEHAEALYNLASGTVYGPYLFNDFYCVSKLVKKSNQVENVTASHILISFKGGENAQPNVTRSKEEAKTLADQLLKEAKANPSNFGKLAEANTDDPGSKTNGGQYSNIPRGQMVPEFDKFIFEKPVNTIDIVETGFGYHIIKVDSKNEKEGVQLATVAKRIEPSSATQDKVHSLATKFEAEVETKDFSKLATELQLIAHPSATIKAFDEELPGAGSFRDAVRWAFNKGTSVNDFKRFSTTAGELIVKVKDVNDTGLKSVEEARVFVEPILMKNKKAEILQKKMTGKTLEEVAKNTKTSVLKVVDANANNLNVGNFQEPKVVGVALNNKANYTSKLIDGRDGVYMIKVTNNTAAPKLPNYEQYKGNVTTNNPNKVNGDVYRALTIKAKIEDNRSKIFN